MRKYSIFCAVITLSFMWGTAYAQSGVTMSQYSYEIYAQFDVQNTQLVKDVNSKTAFTVISEVFEPALTAKSAPLVVIVRDMNGIEIVKVGSPIPEGARPGKIIPLVIRAPYVAYAKTVEIFESGSSRPLMTVDVSSASYCNQNGICDSEKGEEVKSCPMDCQDIPKVIDVFVPVTSSTTQEVSDEESSDAYEIPGEGASTTAVTPEAKTPSIQLIAGIGLLVLGVILGGIYVLLRRREYQKSII